MQITRCNTLAEINGQASDLIIRELQSKPRSLICAATGNSPTGVYQKLIGKRTSVKTEELKFIKLDEWYGLGMNDAGSCEYYLHKYLLQPLNIDPANYIAFDGKSSEPNAECSRILHYLEKHGPIDLCILGLGQNGHIAFNEPAESLQPNAHLAELSKTSLNHSMINDAGIEIKYGFTLGMADILGSRKIILLVNGKHKQTIMNRLLEKHISTQLPASLLWLHADATCFYCESDN